MMGFDEERGIIPRLCEDLVTQIARMDKQQVVCLCYWPCIECEETEMFWYFDTYSVLSFRTLVLIHLLMSVFFY